MHICGIICEYNPFHNGHRYHIQKARELTKCDLLVCVMSGNIVQRGEMAITDKWARARAAVENGCDLVIELPFPYVVQSGDRFAHGAMELLKQAGVHSIVFGSECGNIEKLYEIAKSDINVKNHQVNGISYVKAFEQALHVSLSSNDMLGVFYIKELLDTSIVPHCIQRTNQYHDQDITTSIASATAIRHAFQKGKSTVHTTPMNPNQFYKYSWEDYYPYLQTFFMNASVPYLASLFLMDEGIESLLKKQAQLHSHYDSFLEACISKRYTASRIQRTLIHALTQTTKKEMNELAEPSYLRILAYNPLGQKYLRILQDQGKQVASTFTKIPKQYRDLEYRATTAFVYPFPQEERSAILKRELQSGEVIK